MESDQPFGLLVEMARRELVHLLESLPGNKHLMVEQSLLRPLDKIASMKILQNHGCERVLPFRLDGSVAIPPANAENRTRRVFLARCSLQTATLLANIVRSEPDSPHAVIWVDRRLAIADREFERHGVYGSIECLSLSIPLLPLETDLFSLEMPQSKQVDYYTTANALLQLQSLYGQIPTIYGVGAAASNVMKVLKVLYAECGEPRPSADQPISHLFLLDRNLDSASILMTGLTYEAMVHDVFQIRCAKVSFGAEVEERMKKDTNEHAASKSVITPLDNNDGIFASVRNQHMTAVFPWLSAKAREIQASYEKGASLGELQEMKKFVTSELKTLKSNHRQLETHICACEVLLEKSGSGSASDRLQLEHLLVAGQADLTQLLSFLEDCILAEQSPWSVLSLACLATLCLSGLPMKMFHSFRESLLHAYGYEYMPVLHALQVRRLLYGKASALNKIIPGGDNKLQKEQASTDPSNGLPTLPFLIKRLGLVPTTDQGTLDLRNPDRMSYVFSGAFAPPLCTLIADTMMRGWNIAEVQKTFGSAFGEANTTVPMDRKPDSRMRKAILAFFIGGVTFAEVAALRWLATQNNFRLIIATTHIIHRESWLRCMGDVEETPL